MKQSGSADLVLMGGSIPHWLYERMTKMSLAIVEAILTEYGHQAFLAKMSDPFWFQCFGAVIGMDWNSSGVTTAIMRALKDSLSPHSKELGLYICGGKGKRSLQTPNELHRVGEKTGLDGEVLARNSKLVAKVDNTALQDGFQLYMHNFLVTATGEWTVIQQGMNPDDSTARRYHWHSQTIHSFVEEPHTAVCGINQGEILNLVAKDADQTRASILAITQAHPDNTQKALRKWIAPQQYGVKAKDINLKRLASILWLAQENETTQFEDLLLLKGLGPRTLQSLTLVSEVIHGTPSRFSDPARFSFTHGSKGGRPFPVLTQTYDETISTLRTAVDRAKIGHTDKQQAIHKLTSLAQKAEETISPTESVEELLEKEQHNAWKHGGRTSKGHSTPPTDQQLKLFNDSTFRSRG